MEDLRNDTNQQRYNDIVFEWLEEVRNECDASGSFLLHRERTNAIASIYPDVLNTVHTHMVFTEEYLPEETNGDEDSTELDEFPLDEWERDW